MFSPLGHMAKYHAMQTASDRAELSVDSKQPDLQNRRIFLLGQDAERYAFLTIGKKGQRSVSFVAKTEAPVIRFLRMQNLAEPTLPSKPATP